MRKNAGPGPVRPGNLVAGPSVRETLELMCRELASRGVTLLEADTDGVYFASPDGWTETDERCLVAGIAALLPPLVQLEFEGRFEAMLSHEPKNYAMGRCFCAGSPFIPAELPLALPP